MPSKRIISMSVLPGEPTDGTGRVCIHLFLKDSAGPFVEPHVLHQARDANGNPIRGEVVAMPTRGRLACDRKRTVAPATRKGESGGRETVVTITHRTDDPRAVTCPKCRATAEYAELMSQLGE